MTAKMTKHAGLIAAIGFLLSAAGCAAAPGEPESATGAEDHATATTEQGLLADRGCSNGEIRYAQGRCREFGAVYGEPSRGIHWCSVANDGDVSFGCAW